jgi:hypothetical protein
VLFPKDSARRIEILWKDPEKKNSPASLAIRGERSLWKAIHDISLGTSLKDLERLNGRPFHLSGFGWDYSGSVTSWDKGTLATELDSGHGRLISRLDHFNGRGLTEKEQSDVAGNRDFSSGHPVMQKLNPSASEVIWVFPGG